MVMLNVFAGNFVLEKIYCNEENIHFHNQSYTA